jgi:DNA-directed RNA polymerase alpha subunit
MTQRHLIDPTPELPDDTQIVDVRFPTRLRNVLAVAGLKTVGEVRETTDKTFKLSRSWARLGRTPPKDLWSSVPRRGKTAIIC